MKVLLLGATGMIGQGVLRECLRDPAVTAVACLGRSRSGLVDPKLSEIIVPDLTDFTALAPQLSGCDAASAAWASRPWACRRRSTSASPTA